MAFPNSGLIRFWIDTVSIISGDFALNSDADPQAARPVADLQAYYDLRTEVLANAPCLRRQEIPPASGIFRPAIGDYELQFSPSTRDITFYNAAITNPPDATLDFISADFPMGMSISQLVLYFRGQVNFTADLTTIDYNFFGSNFYDYTPGVGLINGYIGSPSSGAGAIIPSTLTKWSISQVLKQYGHKISILSNTAVPYANWQNCFLVGTYSTGFFTITSTTPNALPGNIVSLSDPGGSFSFLDREEFRIYWTAETGDTESTDFPGMTGGIVISQNNILEYTDTTMIFIMPTDQGLPYGGKRLMLTGTSISSSFVGEFPLYNFNIELVDGSGLYKLTTGQAYDTYYDRSTTPVTTVNIKIP